MKQKHLPLIALCLGFFMVIIDVTIVNVALPSMAKGLGGNISWLQWVVDGYTLTFACLLLSAGNLGDQMGAKTAFLGGLALFVLTSIGCGLATNFLWLTVYRLFQGMAAALLVPTSLALINASYDNKEERAKAIGIWAGIGGIAAAAGPLLGAVLTTWFSWRAVFFVNVPIGLIGFLLTQKYVINPKNHKHMSFDWLGQISAIIAIGALAFSLIEAGRFGWSATIVIIGFLIAFISSLFFLFIEYRTATPMLPLQLFRSKTFSVAIAVGIILNIGVFGQLFVLTLYFQQIKDYSVLTTGFAFVPIMGVSSIASYLSGKMTSRTGPRLGMIIGLTTGAIGLFAMLIVSKQIPYIMLILPLIAMGFGIAFTMPAAIVAAIHAVPEGKAGIASGAFNASRQIGTLLSVAIFGTIIATSTNFIWGMRITLLIGVAAYLFGLVLTLVFIDDRSR